MIPRHCAATLILLFWFTRILTESWAFQSHRTTLLRRDELMYITALRLWDKLDQVMDTFVVKTLFPDDDTQIAAVDPEAVLATFELQQFNDTSALNAAYKSLTNYLQLWARNLEVQPDKGLTTQITATDFRNSSSSYRFLDSTLDGDQSTLHNNLVLSKLPPNVSMTLKFRPPKRYLSYKEQKGMEKGVLPDRKGGKVDAWSPGGIKLLVSVVADDDDNDLPLLLQKKPRGLLWLRLEAKRCDIGKDTVIKYSSERAIIRRLKEAVRIWIKVRETIW